MDGTIDDSCGMTVKRIGMLGVGVRKTKAGTLKTETVTLFDKDRWNMICFVY
jgi:hypothetical protein